MTGCGRGGTNLGIELIRSFGHFSVSEQVEDRSFFLKDSLPALYATKLATENTDFTIENIDRAMKQNPDLFVLFMTRHPVDVCLSKILRGRPRSQGGDSTTEERAADGTVVGAANAVKYMTNIYSFLKREYPNRTLTLKMEDLIESPQDTIKIVSNYFGIPIKEQTHSFFKNNRNNYQKARYGNNLVRNIALYENLDTNFEGFFADKKEAVGKLTNALSEYIHTLEY